MRKSTVVSLNKLKVFDFLYKNKLLLTLYLVFAIGIVLGVISFIKSNTAVSAARKIFEVYLNKRLSDTFVSVFFSSLLTSFAALITAFLLGASVMGVVVSPLYVCFLGFTYGCLSAYLYSEYSVNGVAFNAVVFIPSTAVLLISLILASRHSVNFSLSLAKLTFTNSASRNLYEDFRRYCSSYFVVSAFVLLSALIDAVLSKALIKFFEF